MGSARLVKELGVDHADLVDEQRVHAAPAIAHLQAQRYVRSLVMQAAKLGHAVCVASLYT